MDKDGNVYFSDIGNSRIHKWVVDGKLLSKKVEDDD